MADKKADPAGPGIGDYDELAKALVEMKDGLDSDLNAPKRTRPSCT